MHEERYALKRLPARELQEELNDLWASLQDPDSELSKQAAEQGIDVEPLRKLRLDEAIQIRRESAGFDVDHIVLAFVAHGVVEVLKVTWTHLFFPILKNKFGDGAIKPGG